MSLILGYIIGIWIVCFGFAAMLQSHRWYMNATRRAVRSVVRGLITNPLRRFGRAYRIQIIWFLIGFIAAFVFFSKIYNVVPPN